MSHIEATAAIAEIIGACWRQTTRTIKEIMSEYITTTSRLVTVIPDKAENDGETPSSQRLTRLHFAINDSRTSAIVTTEGRLALI